MGGSEGSGLGKKNCFKKRKLKFLSTNMILDITQDWVKKLFQKEETQVFEKKYDF